MWKQYISLHFLNSTYNKKHVSTLDENYENNFSFHLNIKAEFRHFSPGGNPWNSKGRMHFWIINNHIFQNLPGVGVSFQCSGMCPTRATPWIQQCLQNNFHFYLFCSINVFDIFCCTELNPLSLKFFWQSEDEYPDRKQDKNTVNQTLYKKRLKISLSYIILSR